MKKIVTCRRACIENMVTKEVVAIFSYTYHKDLSDNDILCSLFNPASMEWNGRDLWILGTVCHVSVYNEYAEIEQWFDKIKRVIFN